MMLAALIVSMALAGSLQGQPVPQPFPRPAFTGCSDSALAASPAVVSAAPARGVRRPVAAGGRRGADTERCSACPLYPGAQFITSYDAGRDQRYYLFGSAGSFVDLVAYYRTRAQTEGRARLRGAGDARVRRGQVRREDDGVSAGRDDQGLSVRPVEGLSQPEARRATRPVPDDHPDSVGPGPSLVPHFFNSHPAYTANTRFVSLSTP